MIKFSAPATKKEEPKKGKGSYNRRKKHKIVESDETLLKFMKAVMEENHKDAFDLLKLAVEDNLSRRMEKELDKPLFH